MMFGEPNLHKMTSVNFISHVLFLRTQATIKSRTISSNHLSTQQLSRLFIRSIPSKECPYHNLGFSLVGFTSFHLISFLISSVTVALSRSFNHIQKNLGFPSAVSLSAALPY